MWVLRVKDLDFVQYFSVVNSASRSDQSANSIVSEAKPRAYQSSPMFRCHREAFHPAKYNDVDSLLQCRSIDDVQVQIYGCQWYCQSLVRNRFDWLFWAIEIYRSGARAQSSSWWSMLAMVTVFVREEPRFATETFSVIHRVEWRCVRREAGCHWNEHVVGMVHG